MNGLWLSFGAVVLFICTIESSQNLKILFTLTAFLSDLERCELFFGSNVQHYRSCLFGLLAVSRLSSYLVLIARLFPFTVTSNFLQTSHTHSSNVGASLATPNGNRAFSPTRFGESSLLM